MQCFFSKKGNKFYTDSAGFMFSLPSNSDQLMINSGGYGGFFRSYSHYSAAFDRLYNDEFSIVRKLRKLPPKKSCYPFNLEKCFFQEGFRMLLNR